MSAFIRSHEEDRVKAAAERVWPNVQLDIEVRGMAGAAADSVQIRRMSMCSMELLFALKRTNAADATVRMLEAL